MCVDKEIHQKQKIEIQGIQRSGIWREDALCKAKTGTPNIRDQDNNQNVTEANGDLDPEPVL